MIAAPAVPATASLAPKVTVPLVLVPESRSTTTVLTGEMEKLSPEPKAAPMAPASNKGARSIMARPAKLR